MYRSLLLMALAVAGATAADKKATNAMADYPFAAGMGGTIEGASVDASGNFYAVNSTSVLNLKTGKVLFQGTEATNLYAASRFTRTQGILVGDKKTAGLLVGDAKAHHVFMVDPNASKTVSAASARAVVSSTDFIQPNDMAISASERFLYLSGMNWTDTTIAGTSGELWVIDRMRGDNQGAVRIPRDTLAEAGIHRTNGIEVSHDGLSLFVSSAQNVAGTITASQIYQWDIEPNSGMPSNPRVAVDLYEEIEGAAAAQLDPDGMRMDANGTIFQALHGFQKVLVWKPGNPQRNFIDLETVKYPTNMEFVGPNGTLLVVVGLCADQNSACIDKYQHTTPGKAWSLLQPNWSSSSSSSKAH